MSVDTEMKEAIERVAKAKIAEALGGDVLTTMVDAVMNHRDISYNSQDREKTELEKIVKRNILTIVERCVIEHLEQHSETIKATISEAMTAKANAFASEIIDAFKGQDWNARLNVIINRDDQFS